MIYNIFFLINIILFLPLFAVSIYNYFTAPRFKKSKLINWNKAKVSILIPARNEQKNIAECLEKALDQDYPFFEVLVLDDRSEDKTASFVERIAVQDKRIRLISGKPLPKGWIGKSWACWQLAQEAKGEYLLFIDADVRMESWALTSALTSMKVQNIDMLSVFPTQIMKTIGEKLIVPLMNWVLLTFLPLRSVYTKANPLLSAACGGFILFEKNSYFEIGGHEILRKKIVEDVEFAREYKRRGKKVLTMLGEKNVFCRMYEGFSSSLQGFAKNFYSGSGLNIFSFIFILLITTINFMAPFVLVFFELKFLVLIGLLFLQRLVLSKRSSQNIWENTYLFLPQIILLPIIGLVSVYQTVSGKVEWRGRKIKR